MTENPEPINSLQELLEVLMAKIKRLEAENQELRGRLREMKTPKGNGHV
jgi:chaperonin cofactor prefoldin